MSYDRMKAEGVGLKQEIAKLLAQARATGEAEDQGHGPGRRGDELPDELTRRQSRSAEIQTAKKWLAGRARIEAAEEADRRQAEGKSPPAKPPAEAAPRPQGPDQLHRPRVADHEALEQGMGPVRRCPGRGR